VAKILEFKLNQEMKIFLVVFTFYSSWQLLIMIKNLFNIRYAFLLLLFVSVAFLAFSKPRPITKKETNRIVKLYENNNFNGVKLHKYKRKNYLICAVEVPISASQDIYTLAKVKAQAYINEFLNGASVTSASSFILEENTQSQSTANNTETDSKSAQEYVNKMITTIKTNASGFVNNIESVATFKSGNVSTKTVFLFAKQI